MRAETMQVTGLGRANRRGWPGGGRRGRCMTPGKIVADLHAAGYQITPVKSVPEVSGMYR